MFAIEMAIFGSEVFFCKRCSFRSQTFSEFLKTILNLKFFLGGAGNVD